MKMGMTKNDSRPPQWSAQELQLIEQLREHPLLLERFQAILAITANAEGPLKSADEVEGLLIEETRRLGNTTMGSWAARAEERLAEQLEQKDASAGVRKQKTLKGWCVFGVVSVRERVWRTAEQNYLRLLPKAIGVSSRGRSIRLERVLTDFGCEHSFAHAAARVQEHYGFETGVSAVRGATWEHAQRADQKREEESQEPFRILPAVGAEHVIAEADGTMICTVASGKRKGKRPREWKEMRLTAAQAQGKVQTVYAATFGSVEEVGRRWGHCARQAGWGFNSQIHALGDGAEWIRLQTEGSVRQTGDLLVRLFPCQRVFGSRSPELQKSSSGPVAPNPTGSTQARGVGESRCSIG